ncbi:hypothetical protein BGX26_002930, partial [Mortierella sp. AD094]
MSSISASNTKQSSSAVDKAKRNTLSAVTGKGTADKLIALLEEARDFDMSVVTGGGIDDRMIALLEKLDVKDRAGREECK